MDVVYDLPKVDSQITDREPVGHRDIGGDADEELMQREPLRSKCDELGQFSFATKPSGPVRLVARLAGGDVVTEWFTV